MKNYFQNLNNCLDFINQNYLKFNSDSAFKKKLTKKIKIFKLKIREKKMLCNFYLKNQMGYSVDSVGGNKS